MLEISTRNRMLECALCADPRKHGKIELAEPNAQSEGLGFGVVLVVDATPAHPTNERPRPDLKVDDVIFFRAGAAQPVVTDYEQTHFLVSEYDVMRVIRGAKINRLDATAKVGKPAPPRLVRVNGAG